MKAIVENTPSEGYSGFTYPASVAEKEQKIKQYSEKIELLRNEIDQLKDNPFVCGVCGKPCTLTKQSIYGSIPMPVCDEHKHLSTSLGFDEKIGHNRMGFMDENNNWVEQPFFGMRLNDCKKENALKREPGYYWVKFDNEWCIAEYNNIGRWSFIGWDAQIQDYDLQDINENKIEKS